MGADAETLGFYDREARAYADYAEQTAERERLAQFAARLAPGRRVLDFGCGSGWATAALAGMGFAAEGLDGSAGLAAEAGRRYGIAVRVMRFEDFAAEAAYGGIWAAFSLLHDSRAAMPGHLSRLRRALVPGGWLYLGLKAGEGESRDRLGRRYTYYGAAEIDGLLRAAGFDAPEVAEERAKGYDGSTTGMLHALARAGG